MKLNLVSFRFFHVFGKNIVDYHFYFFGYRKQRLLHILNTFDAVKCIGFLGNMISKK